MSRVAALAARREALLARSGALRERLNACGRDLDESVAGIERGVRFARSVMSRPVLLVAGAALLVALRPKSLFGWVSRGLFVGSLVKKADTLISARRAPPRHEWDPSIDYDQLGI
jgi:hypothetical protein